MFLNFNAQFLKRLITINKLKYKDKLLFYRIVLQNFSKMHRLLTPFNSLKILKNKKINKRPIAFLRKLFLN